MTKVERFKITKTGQKEIKLKLTREGDTVETRGLIILKDDQNFSLDIEARLQAPGASHHCWLAVIVRDNARVVIDANIVVEQAAAKATARLKVLVLITGGEPKVTVLPKMEVKNKSSAAIHGVSTVRLLPESYFYAASRGLGPQVITELLVSNLIEEYEH